MSKEEQEAFMSDIARLWARSPHKSFARFIFEVSKNPTELYVLSNKELIKRLEKENS
jgi:hypothetical protein